MDRTILLVEDSADDAELTVLAFRRNRIDNPVRIARDGAEALAILLPDSAAECAAVHEQPALVILDLNLPKVPGLDVLRRIRAEPRTQRLPVVILTTSTEQTEVLRSYRLGANAYVRKPVSFDEFVTAAGRMGLFWLMLNVPPGPPA
ncbi:MAG TPA: response regulator [Burkholderiales bacterium]|nr:response regulator [Burkholderiales bacterium]